jgi:hypothetical protein
MVKCADNATDQAAAVGGLIGSEVVFDDDDRDTEGAARKSTRKASANGGLRHGDGLDGGPYGTPRFVLYPGYRPARPPKLLTCVNVTLAAARGTSGARQDQARRRSRRVFDHRNRATDGSKCPAFRPLWRAQADAGRS